MSHGATEASPTVFSKDPGWRRWLYLGSRPCHCETQGEWIVFRTGEEASCFPIASVQSVGLDNQRSVGVRLKENGALRHYWFILRGDATTTMATFRQFTEALQQVNPTVEIAMLW